MTRHILRPTSRSSAPAVGPIVRCGQTITMLARYNEVASTVMRLLAEASTTLGGIKAKRRL